MSRILNSLVISERIETLRDLDRIMSSNIEGHILSFALFPLNDLGALDREPDLIFIDNEPEVSGKDISKIVEKFPRKTCVVLDSHPEQFRDLYLKMGIDEVMSLSSLESDIGKHLLGKLLAFKDLAAAEARADREEGRFRGIIEHSHDMIVLLDAEGKVIYVSPSFTRQTSHNAWEVLGQDFWELVCEDDRELALGNYRHLVSVGAGASSSLLEFRLSHKEGSLRFVEAQGANLLHDETVKAVVLHCRDVTQQKEAEWELERYRLHLEDMVVQRTREVAEANRRADTVLAASPDALLAVDEDGYITFVSKHYRVSYPHSAQLLEAGVHVLDAFRIVNHEVGLDEYDPRYAEMLEWWLHPRGSKEFRMDNGTWLRLRARRMPDGGGIVISTTNITDYKRQQALLAEQSAQLSKALDKERERAEQQKTFISTVSHEFRTPLAIIDGNAQIIQKRGDAIGKAALETRAGTIRAAVDRLVRLIETILSTHMLESGKLALEPSPCDLAQLLRDVCAEQQEISPNHEINLDIKGLPSQMMLDERYIRQMLVNLLVNAVKYSPQAQSAEVMAFVENGDVVIEVQDHGVGIPENEWSRIFERYYRASTSSGIPGTGLGLSLVRQFVNLHRGKVSLRSKVGVGTVVTVSLPVEGVEMARQDASEEIA